MPESRFFLFHVKHSEPRLYSDVWEMFHVKHYTSRYND